MNAIPAIAVFGTPGERNAGAVASFVVDLDRRRLVAVDAAAARLWGLPASAGGHDLPLDLDAGTPALSALASSALAPPGGLHCGRDVRDGPSPLTFWTRHGVRTWPCLVRLQLGASGERLAHVIVVEPLPVPGVDSAPAAVACAGAPPGCGPAAVASPHVVAKLAHELRTPLSAILTMADVLAEQRFGPLQDPRYADYARTIGDTARHAIGVVAAMLASDRPEEARAEPTFVELDLEALAAECSRSIEALATRSGVILDCALTGCLPRVIADRVSVQQIVLNLLANGLEHAGAGARVTVRSGCDPGGEAWLEVTDDGPGIAGGSGRSDDDRLSADASCEGSGARGIGLPLARSLALVNGARLDLGNAEPHGTRARLVFEASRTIPV